MDEILKDEDKNKVAAVTEAFKIFRRDPSGLD